MLFEGAQPSGVAPARESATRHWPAIAVALVAVAVYANSLANGFASDDVWVILQNARVHRLSELAGIWLTPYWPGDRGVEMGVYRPLTISLFAVEWAAGAGRAWIFHAANIALYAGVSILVYCLLSAFSRRRFAAAGALVFAVHPLHTEAVANVVGQAELLVALGVLGACLIHVRGRERRSARHWLPIAALFGLALLSKEHAIVLPALLIALDAARGRLKPDVADVRRYATEEWRLYAALAVTAVGYLVLRFAVLGSIASMDPSWGLGDPATRVFTALRAWNEYVRLLFFPADLSARYGPAVILPSTSLDASVALGGILLLGVATLALLTARRPRIGLPAAWFLLCVLPVSNIIFPTAMIVAERTLFLPSVAVAFMSCFLLEAVAGHGRPRVRRRFAWAAVAAIVALMVTRTVTRNPDWKSTNAMLTALLRDHPESYQAQWAAAVSAEDRGAYAVAADHFELAYRLWPNDLELVAAYAEFLIQQGRYAGAVRVLESPIVASDTTGSLANLLERTRSMASGSVSATGAAQWVPGS